MSRQAARLEKSGWIRRHDDARDARAYHLHPAAPCACSGSCPPLAAGLRTDYLRGLPDPRVLALMGDLIVIKDNLLRMDTGHKKLSA